MKPKYSATIQYVYRLFNSGPAMDPKRYILYGEETIAHALKAGRVEHIYCASHCPFEFGNCTKIGSEAIQYITRGKENSLIAVCVKKALKPLPLSDARRVLILDHVSYRINIGIILRLAFALGVDQVYKAEDDGLNYEVQTVVKQSGGASLYMPIIAADLPKTIKELKKNGFYCIGTSLESSLPLSKIPETEKMAVILGNEANGVTSEVLAETDVNCRIEMENYDSLNVGIAGAIILSRFCR